MVKSSRANAGDVRDSGSTPGLGRSPGAGESPLLSRSGGEKGLRGSGAGTLGVPLDQLCMDTEIRFRNGEEP